ncbi:MAG: hypothetical protein R3246_16215, partial [Acidimicrobiia bacterium]|nr:hypothetical protein [Acidimicrobiia bacterium]
MFGTPIGGAEPSPPRPPAGSVTCLTNVESLEIDIALASGENLFQRNFNLIFKIKPARLPPRRACS